MSIAAIRALPANALEAGKRLAGDTTATSLLSLLQTAFRNNTSRGIIPSARLPLALNPVDTNTIVIGAHTFTFVAALGAAAANTQILLGGAVAASRTNLLNAINGVASASVVPGTVAVPSIVADEVAAGVIRIRLAATRGGAATPGTLAAALAETMGGAGNGPWSAANMNVSGRAEAEVQVTTGQVAITAEMVTATAYQLELPFTPTVLVWNVTTAGGVLRASTDAVTIVGDAINIALAGGAPPAVQATDVFRFVALS